MNRILTISLGINTHDLNFGAILHNFAMLKYLNGTSAATAEMLNYVPDAFVDFDYLNPENYYLKLQQDDDAKLFSNIKTDFSIRYQKFEDFKEKYIPITTKKYLGSNSVSNIENYDTVIAESDVIWRPNFFGGQFDPTFFMYQPTFKNMNKIAYAPSAANDHFNSEQKANFKKLTRDINFISTRESYSVTNFSKLTNRTDIIQVVDPVFLIDKQIYDNIASTSQVAIPNKYLLIYLPVDDNLKLVSQAVEYARKNNLEIIELSNKVRQRNHRVLYNLGPEDFLALIKGTNIVFTNSFHGICFSIIYQKDFYGFTRENPGKVKDICDQLNLSSRYFVNDQLIEQSSINYNSVYKLLERNIQSSITWLNNALKN